MAQGHVSGTIMGLFLMAILSPAKQQGARVVYLGFGALHAHGVIEQLRQYSVSYIVFSPNF